MSLLSVGFGAPVSPAEVNPHGLLQSPEPTLWGENQFLQVILSHPHPHGLAHTCSLKKQKINN